MIMVFVCEMNGLTIAIDLIGNSAIAFGIPAVY